MTFAQNVTLNGKATTNYKYDSKTRTLLLMPDPIGPNKTVTFTFDVTIDKGTEGTSFTNVAVLHDGDNETEVPSVPVDVPLGQANISISKRANKEYVEDLDVLRYTVVVKNDTDSPMLHNATVTDFLPKELSLVGGPYIDSYLDPDAYKNGNSIGVDLVKLEPGETVEISYDVQVRNGTQKTVRHKADEDKAVVDKMIKDNTITLTNIAIASGDNGSASTTDSTVKVPPIVEVIPEEGGDTDPPQPDEKTFIIKKDTEKTHVDITNDPDNIYTITLENPTKEVWKNVRVVDDIITIKEHLHADTVKVDGVPRKYNKDYIYIPSVESEEYRDEMTIPVGDIQPGEKVVIEFKVRFSSDNVRKDAEFVNEAIAKSDNYKDISAKAPTVTRINPTSLTGMHNKIIVGTSLGDNPWEWWPNYSASTPHKAMSFQEGAAIIGRVLTMDKRGEIWNGYDLNDSMKDLEGYDAINEWDAPPVRFMMFSGAITPGDFDLNELNQGTDYITFKGMHRIFCTRNQIGRMLKSVGLEGVPHLDYSSENPDTKTSRLNFADEICIISHRDKNPAIGSCSVNTFPDVNSPLVSETSTFHNYVLIANGMDEIWTISIPSRGVEC